MYSVYYSSINNKCIQWTRISTKNKSAISNLMNCVQCRRTATFFCSSCGPEVAYCSVDCQRAHWETHCNECRSAVTQEPVSQNGRPERGSEEEAEFYIHQMYLILIPVFANICLSILWVKLSNPTPIYFGNSVDPGKGTLPSAGAIFAGDNANAQDSLKQVLIIMGQIVGATFLILILIKFRCMKVSTFFCWLINILGALWIIYHHCIGTAGSLWLYSREYAAKRL